MDFTAPATSVTNVYLDCYNASEEKVVAWQKCTYDPSVNDIVTYSGITDDITKIVVSIGYGTEPLTFTINR